MKTTCVYVHNPTQTPLVLSLLMEIFLTSLDALAIGHAFVTSLAVSFAEMSRRIHDFLVSPACITTDARRARAISRLVLAVSTGLQCLSPYHHIADPMRLHLLIRRLNDGPNEAWESSDKLLVEAFSVPFSRPILRADALSVLILLRQDRWGEHGRQLRVSVFTFVSTQTLIRGMAVVDSRGSVPRSCCATS